MLECTYTFWISSLKSSHENWHRPPHPRTGIMTVVKATSWQIMENSGNDRNYALMCLARAWREQTLSVAVYAFSEVPGWLPEGEPIRVGNALSGSLWSVHRAPWFYNKERRPGKEKVEGGRNKARGAESLISNSPSVGAVTSGGAAGAPASPGTSTVGSGESVDRGRMAPGDRWCDSQVCRESLQGSVPHLPPLSIHDESLSPNGAWSWGKFSCTVEPPRIADVNV